MASTIEEFSLADREGVEEENGKCTMAQFAVMLCRGASCVA